MKALQDNERPEEVEDANTHASLAAEYSVLRAQQLHMLESKETLQNMITEQLTIW